MQDTTIYVVLYATTRNIWPFCTGYVKDINSLLLIDNLLTIFYFFYIAQCLAKKFGYAFNKSFMFFLEKIYKEKINSAIIYMNESITVENFSSSVWKVSDFTSKILASIDGLVKMQISVFPNGYNKYYKKHASVYVSLLSGRQHCHVSTTQLSILTPKRTQRNEKIFHSDWPEYETNYMYGLPKFISRHAFRNFSEDFLNDDKLTILIEVVCLSLSERQSESLINLSPVNSVEMWYDWNVCNFSTFPDVPNSQIFSAKFPSDSELIQFHLILQPRNMKNSQEGYILLYLCWCDGNQAKPSLLVNYTFTIRNYGADGEVLREHPYANVFEASGVSCWGTRNILLYEKAIKKSCLAIELRSVYNAF